MPWTSRFFPFFALQGKFTKSLFLYINPPQTAIVRILILIMESQDINCEAFYDQKYIYILNILCCIHSVHITVGITLDLVFQNKNYCRSLITYGEATDEYWQQINKYIPLTLLLIGGFLPLLLMGRGLILSTRFLLVKTIEFFCCNFFAW